MIVTVLLLVGLAGALAASAFYSGTETGVYTLNHVRLRVAAARGAPGARRGERLLRHPEDLVITSLLGTNVADYIATACATALFLRLASDAGLAEFYATMLVTPLVFVFGGIVPKDWFRRDSNRLMAALNLPNLGSVLAARLTGLVWLLRALTRGLVRWIDPQHDPARPDLVPRAQTLHLLREGAARGRLTSVQRDLIERVLRLADIRVADVMIVRARAATVSRDIRRDDFLRIARMAHFSRLPVWRDDPRRIIGIVNVYDVLTDAQQRPVNAHIRPPLVLPSQMPVSAALLKLQAARQAMAIVEDGAGHCVGVLTLKDLVEEIVGDLEAW